MKYLPHVLIVLLSSTPAVLAQSAFEEPKSLAEIARESKKQKSQAKIVVTDENHQPDKPLIPDVFSGGLDNIDEILKAIDNYRSTHNLQETQDVVHAWYDKHDALLANAIEQNRRIEQRERDRQLGYPLSGAQPRNGEEYVEMQRMEVASRRDDLKRKQENGLLSARIQQAFNRVRTQMKQKYGMNIDWMKIRCGNGNCSF